MEKTCLIIILLLSLLLQVQNTINSFDFFYRFTVWTVLEWEGLGIAQWQLCLFTCMTWIGGDAPQIKLGARNANGSIQAWSPSLPLTPYLPSQLSVSIFTCRAQSCYAQNSTVASRQNSVLLTCNTENWIIDREMSSSLKLVGDMHLFNGFRWVLSGWPITSHNKQLQNSRTTFWTAGR